MSTIERTGADIQEREHDQPNEKWKSGSRTAEALAAAQHQFNSVRVQAVPEPSTLARAEVGILVSLRQDSSRSESVGSRESVAREPVEGNESVAIRSDPELARADFFEIVTSS
jgi:hypothetical protein